MLSPFKTKSFKHCLAYLCFTLLLAFLSACDDETIDQSDAAVRDLSIMAGSEAGLEAGAEAGSEAGFQAGSEAGNEFDEGMAGSLANDLGLAGNETSDQGNAGEPIPETCTEGLSYCEGETAVITCVDGAYTEPVNCLNGELCLAGRCISNCERAAVRSDYQGCSFWAIDSDNIVDADGNGPGAAPSAVVLSNVSDSDASVTIEDAEGVIVHQALLLAGQTQSFNLPRADLIGTHLGGQAWHIGTNQPVLAYLFTPLQRTSTSSVDATLLIPSPALDDSYRVLTWPGQGYNQRGTLSIVAVEEGPSTVTIVPPEPVSEGVDFRGAMQSTMHKLVSPLPNQAWTEILERGEVLNVQSAPFADLSGTLVLSDQKLAVFAGTRCSNIPDQTPRCDHLEHQMLPLRNQGRNYIAPGGLPRASESTWYRVVATVDQTIINTNPVLPNTPIILNAGQVATLSSDGPFALNSSAPVMLGMFLASAEAGANGLGDPSFVLLPPVEQFKDRYVFLTPEDFERDGLTLIANGEAMVTLDGQLIDTTWTAVSDTTWKVAHLDISDGPHEISSAQEFAIIATGYDEEVSYAFTGGLRLEKLRESEPPPYVGLCAAGEAPETPCETGLSGVCSVGRLTCLPSQAASCQALLSPQEEICNRLDDDCDGLIDEAQCADFTLERVAPLSDRLTLTEGETAVFNIRAQGSASGQEVIWSVDGVPFYGVNGLSLEWTPLGFEEGARVVSAKVSNGERVAEITWLVLVNDAPSNKAVIWGQVSLADHSISPAGLTLELSEGISEGETIIDPRGYYAIAVEPSRYDIKIDTLFHRQEPFPRGIVTLVEDIDVDRLNVQRDIVLPISKLSGIVSQANGQVLANTELSFDGDCFACDQQALSDANGAYETLLYHASWEINATPPVSTGLPTKTINDVNVNADRILDIVFSTLYNISALVVDQYNQPVSGATITFDSDEAEVSQASGADGRLNINLPSGDYLVQLDTLFYPRPPSIGRGIAPIFESFNISSNMDNVILPLPNAWVSGQVTGQGDGLPQAGVELYFDADSSCFACSGRTTSDVNGNYGVPLLHGRYAKSLTPPANSEYVNQDGSAITVSADLEHNVVLQGPAVVVSGTLVDPRGDLVTGVGLRTNGPTEVQTTTDALGQFELRLLPGEYAFKIDTLFGARPAGIPTGWVNFWEGTLSADTTQVYTAPFSWISGRVQEAAGDVIPNAVINFNGDCFACSQEVSSAADGTYEATLFQGIYTLEVTPPAPYPQQSIEDVDCTALDTVFNIDL